MYSSGGGGDVRSALAPHLRDSSSAPSDYAPADMWERQAFRPDKFDCAERDQLPPAKRDWPADTRASSARSSNTLFSNLATSGSSTKRRALGRHGSAHENGRYGVGMGRHVDSASNVRSPPENGKAERDFFSLAGGPSPGYSSSPSTEKPGKECDGHHGRASHLSPCEARPASSPRSNRSPRFESPVRRYGAQDVNEVSSLREWERRKLSSSSILQETPYRDKERGWGRTDYHRRTYSLPKLDSPRDWGGGDKHLLEGRIDRYGSASSRELAFSDVLSNSKEHYRYDWRTRDRSLFGGFSTHSTRAPLSSLHLKDVCATPSSLEDPGPTTSPPRQFASQKNLSTQTSYDANEGPSSPRKRPRLTWGQGLAKYEKEKIGEGHSTCKKGENGHDGVAECHEDTHNSTCKKGENGHHGVAEFHEETHDSTCKEGESGHDGVAEFHEDTHVSSDCQSRLTENGIISPLHNRQCLPEQDSCDSGAAQSGCEFERSLPPQDMVIGSSHGSFSNGHLENQSNGADITLLQDLALPNVSPLPPVLHDVQVLLSSSLRERSGVSKDVLIQQVEKVEQEIEHLEKELIKLNNDQTQEIVHTCDALRIEVQGDELTEEIVSATENQSEHCEDQLAIVAMNAENPSLLQDGSAHVQVPEVSGGANMLLAAVEQLHADTGKNDVHNFVPDISVCVEQPYELQFEAVNLRPDLEMSNTDENVGFVESILLSNKHIAQQSVASLSHLSSLQLAANLESEGLYDSPQQAAIWRFNAESHSWKKKWLQAKVLEEAESVRFMEKVLALKYRAQREAWLQKQGESCHKVEWDNSFKILEAEQRDDANSTIYQPSFKSHFATDSMAIMDSRRSEQVDLAERLENSSHMDYERGFLRMPAMHLGSKDRVLRRFDTKNGLVEDPVAAEKERRSSNPWSEEERSVFLEKYSLLGKDFRGIAAYLEHKTVADCVEFYYRNQKTQEFEKVHLKRRLEKRCRFQLEKYSFQRSAYCLATNPPVDSRHYDRNSACLEGLSLVAAAAAAMSAPAKPTYRGLATQACIKVAPTKFAVKGMRNLECKGARISLSRGRASDVEWSDTERETFMNAVVLFGKDFNSISQHMGTRSVRQCRSFFSKARRCLGLDQLVERHEVTLQASKARGLVSAPSSDYMRTKPVPGAEIDLLQHQCKATDLPAAEFAELLQVNDSKDAREPDLIESAEEIGNGVCISPKTSAHESVSHMDDQIKQEACMQFESGEKSSSIGAKVSSSSQALSLDSSKHWRLQESLVCGETPPFKNELISVKAETAHAADSSNRALSDIHSVSAPSEAPSAVSTSVSDSIPVALAVESAPIKETTLRVTETKTRREPTSWTPAEKEKFVEVLRLHGKNWDRLRESIPGKSLTQIKTYFQNSKAKLGLGPEGIINGNGRVSFSRKRKVDDSDSSSNACSGVDNTSQKVPVHSEDGNLKVSPSLFATSGGIGSCSLAAELMYVNLLNRSSVEDAQKIFQSKGLTPSTSIANLSPLFNPSVSVLTSSNLPAPQPPYGHQNSVKVQSIQQATSPLVVVQPLQQQMGSLGAHPMHQPQQQSSSQPATRALQDHTLPVVQHLHKQPAMLQSEANQQNFLNQHQQPVMQQQATEGVLQQHLPTHLPRQQIQIIASHRQASHNHLHQMSSQHQAHASQQAPEQVVSPLLQGTSQSTGTQVAPGNQSISNNEQLQQQAELFHSQLYQMQVKSPSFLQQQWQQQQIHKLQLLQFYWQQQQAQLQQAPAKQVLSQISPLPSLNVTFLNEQQQQLAVLRGIMQSSSQCPEALKQSDFQNSKLSRTQQGVGGDSHQLTATLQGTQMPSKLQVASESQLQPADVKLFGQSLLSQPASSGQQQNGKIFGLSPQSRLPATTSSFTADKSNTNQSPAEAVSQGLGCPHSIWPAAPPVNGLINIGSSNAHAARANGGLESEACSAQEAVARMNERLIRGAKTNQDGQANEGGSSVSASASTSSRQTTDSRGICNHSDPMVQPYDLKRPDCDRRSIHDCEKPANKQRLQDFQAPSVASGQEAFQGLPRVLDALVALAEWRIQNANGGSGKLMDEFLNQSWEALQRDPGSLVEAGKAGGSLAQMYAGNGEILKHSKDGFPRMPLFGGANGGSIRAGSAGHFTGLTDGLSHPSSLFCAFNGEHDVRDEGRGVIG